MDIAAEGMTRLTRAEAAWTLTESANEPWYNLVQRYAFAPYFVAVLGAGGSGGGNGAALWGLTLGAGGLAIALLAPLLGVVADSGRRLKPWLLGVTGLAMLAACSLWFAAPGAPLWLVAVAVFFGTVGAELMGQFANAFLPRIAPARRFGLLSGVAFGLSQVAGIMALLLILAVSRQPPGFLADVPHAAARLTGPLAAAAMILFLLPFLLLEREHPAVPTARPPALTALKTTLRQAWATRPLRLFLIGRMLAADGMAVIFAFGAVLGAESFSWDSGTLAIFGLAITVFGVAGGFLAGWLDRWLGAWRLVILGVALVFAGTASVLLTDGQHLLGVATGVVASAALSSPQEWGFLGAGMGIALGAAFAISAMRALMAGLIPPGADAAYFGLYALVGKATAFVGPTLVGLIAAATGSVRWGVVVALVFLGLGLTAIWAMKAPEPTG